MPTRHRVHPAIWIGLHLGTALLLSSAASQHAGAATAQQVSAGVDHSCALTLAGDVLCWGHNDVGQLGNGAAGLDSPVPTPVSGFASGATALDAGAGHSCAVDVAGGAWCWGTNGSGQLGDGTQTDRDAPVAVSGLSSGVAAVAVGSDHACAVTTGGAVLCWGENADGELGNGSNTSSPVPVAVTGLASGVAAASLGSNFSCALTDVGSVLCWGGGGSGQLGNVAAGDSPVPVAVNGLSSGVAAIAAGSNFACALLQTGGVSCWGSNYFGTLGTPPDIGSSVPVAIAGLPSDVVSLSAGENHVCAGAGAGGVWCWGENLYGQLGNGTTVDSHVPVPVSGLTARVDALGAGLVHTCAATAQGALWCWGAGLEGQLGNGVAVQHPTPVAVDGVSRGATSIATGETHTCAAKDGSVLCWGSNAFGQLGTGVLSIWSGTPIRVDGLPGNASRVTAGESHTCILASGGGVFCWGYNGFGQVGDVSPPELVVFTPFALSSLSSGVADLGAGRWHSCAALGNGEARCWGDNEGAQLGDGTTTSRSNPVPVSGLSGSVEAVAAGGYFSCALTIAGEVECWGTGRLGNGGTSVESPPVAVSGLSNVEEIAAGAYHGCALSAGAVSCWGQNSEGQLGDGTTINRDLPVPVSGLPGGIVAIAAGERHTCAATVSQALCWGANFMGQLGDGTTIDRLLPVVVVGLPTGVQALAAGTWHSCAITAGGSLWCWGDNGWGELGNGLPVSTTPVAVIGFETPPAVPALGPAAWLLLSAALAAIARRRLAAT